MNRAQRRRLRRLMERNHGVVTTEQARDLGVNDHNLARAVRRGELVRRRRRVYTPMGMPMTFWGQIAADIASCERPAVVARTAALHLIGIRPDWLGLQREILVAGSSLPLVGGDVVVHRTRELTDIDLWSVNGFQATRPPRTLIDLYPDLSRVRRLELLDHMACSNWCPAPMIHERAAMLWRGRAGVKELADLTGDEGAARFRSRLERQGIHLVRAAGVRDPQVNVVPRDAPGAGLTDVVSEPDRLIVDWDGLRFHAGPAARQRDNDKANAAALGGYTSLRFTWNDQERRPGHVIATMIAARSRRRR